MKPHFIYSRITPENIQHAWPLAMPWIAKAIDEVNPDHAELIHIQKGLQQGYLQLWSIQDKRKENEPLLFLVTELHTVAGFKTLILRWAAGKEMHEWIDDLEFLEFLAAQEGYHKIEAWGRPGWEKSLKPYGYRKEFVIVSKLISRGLN